MIEALAIIYLVCYIIGLITMPFRLLANDDSLDKDAKEKLSCLALMVLPFVIVNLFVGPAIAIMILAG